ncbi:riboflavin kinase [Recurvomyces mirabilis]|uniref:Riboflavin kinase n=1 Tax=Recurvomyces mirabilis TaxID=574656 RepID=A0AAE0WV34_9PEZI|nr:riboflavin kinase [Recurvomyces mirabilis]KAK5156655.1 riboflavin kinase [Recurvomyces mirabilis]
MSTSRREREPTAGPDAGPQPPYPLRLDGKVIKGFGRGSSELGIPTANIPISGLSVGGHSDVESGVYYGWAGLSPSETLTRSPPHERSRYTHLPTSLHEPLLHVSGSKAAITESGAVYPMVMSIGWNPYYKNTVRSVEVHVMHDFAQDFYGSHMNLAILGYIRPELDYVSKEKLIEDIVTDIEVAGRSLARDKYMEFRNDPYLLQFEGKGEVGS